MIKSLKVMPRREIKILRVKVSGACVGVRENAKLRKI